MSQIAVEKVDGKDGLRISVFDEIKTLSGKIRERAFELFECRGCTDGLAVDDWLYAEHELFRVPEAELTEKDGKFKVLLNVPGFDPADMYFTALSDALIVRGLSTHQHDKNDGDVRFCDSTRKRCSGVSIAETYRRQKGDCESGKGRPAADGGQSKGRIGAATSSRSLRVRNSDHRL